MSDILQSIADFFTDIFNAIGDLITWIADLVTKLNAIDINTSGLVDILGTYRYLVGDTVYMIHITGFYIGVFLMAFKTIPVVASWWKYFKP